MGIATVIGGAGSSGPGFTTIPYTASFTPLWSNGSYQKMLLTGNVTVNNPTGVPSGTGWPLFFIFTQDSSGLHSITWGSAYAPGSPAIFPPQPIKRANVTTIFWFVLTDVPGIYELILWNSSNQ